MGQKLPPSSIDSAKAAFEEYVAENHEIENYEADIIERPELHTPPFYGFVAVQGEGDERKYVRGMASAGEVLTYRTPEAFTRYLADMDFVHSDAVTAVQFVEIYRLLQEPDANPYREASWPILYQQQKDTAPVSHLDEPIELPAVERRGESKRVTVWWQLEPGTRFELWTFTVAPDNSFTLERRLARYKQ